MVILVQHRVYKNYVYRVVSETVTHWITDLSRSKAHGGYLLKELFEVIAEE